MKRYQCALALGAILALGAGGGLLLLRTGFFASIGSLEQFQAYIERFSPFSQLVYFLVQFLSVVIAPIPSNVTALAGALVFGMWPAFLLTAAAVVSGSVLVFCLARTLGQSFADKLVSRKLSEKYLDIIRRKRDVFLALAFLFPFFPDDILCILAGLTDIPLRRFVVIAVLTRPWGLLAACALGGSVIEIPMWAMILLGLAGVMVFLVVLKYGDRWEDAILRRFQK